MRIAVFTGTFPVLSETFILRQITGLLDIGHDVHIYAEERPDSTGPVQLDVLEYNLPARTTYLDLPPASGYWEMPVLPIAGRTWLPGASTSLLNIARISSAAPAFARCLARSPMLAMKSLLPREYGYRAKSLSTLLRLAALQHGRGRYDLAHAHFGPVADSVRFVRELWGVPLLVSFHGYDFSSWPREKGQHVYSRLFHGVDAVTVNSQYTRGKLLRLGSPPLRTHVLPMGVNLARFPFQERTPPPAGEPLRLLTVGRLVEKKGLEYAIRAVATLREAHPCISYNIVGDGPLMRNLQRLVADLRLAGTVTLHGALDGDAVQGQMDGAHLFIMPSVTALDGDVEGQGLALQEAQACGLPVLATNHNGFPESIVPGASGLLVPERDVASLSAALAYLIEHAEQWPQMGRAGRRHVEEHYDICKLNRGLELLYQTTISNYRAQQRNGKRRL